MRLLDDGCICSLLDGLGQWSGLNTTKLRVERRYKITEFLHICSVLEVRHIGVFEQS